MGTEFDRQSQDERAIAAAVDTFLNTERMRRSERLRAFLSYVTSETLAGRGTEIRAKTIALDVYGRDPSSKDYSENVVRVDARRLRRLLDEYYSGEGRDADWRIGLPTGGYTPQFEYLNTATSALQGSSVTDGVAWQKTALIGSAVAALAVVFVLGTVATRNTQKVSSSSHNTSEAERAALIARSGASLQAENLCRQGRNLLFPIADVAQQNLATGLFYRAVELDPSYACGYAGAAHSLGTQAILASPGETKDTLLSEAQEMAMKAQSISPTDGWVVSGMAWVATAIGDIEKAFELSKLSAELSPNDGNVLDFHGVISIFSGDYQEARRATKPDRERDTEGLQHARQNIFGVASYHNGNYSEAVEAFKSAIRLGEPVSALTLIFLAVSHQANGDEAQASNYARDLEDGFPNFPVRAVLQRIYPDKNASNGIIRHLLEAGWTEAPPQQQEMSDG